MSEQEAKPLQATFDTDEEVETVEATGFERGTAYTLVMERAPTGKYMQYGAKRTDGLAGLYVLGNKVPKELKADYQQHPDRFEIFRSGEINGQQALVPGSDFDKFKPFLTRTMKVAWKCEENGRLIFMDLPYVPVVNPSHPEWENISAKLARKMSHDLKAKESFSWSFLHPGVRIKAEIVMKQIKGTDKENPEIDIDTVTLADEESKPQKTIAPELDPEMSAIVLECSDGAKNIAGIIQKVKKYLKENDMEAGPEIIGKYMAVASAMKSSGMILA